MKVAEWARDALNAADPGAGDKLAEWARDALNAADRGWWDTGLQWPLASLTVAKCVRCQPEHLALLDLTVQDIKRGGYKPVVRMGATAEGRAAVQVLAAGPPKLEDYPWRVTDTLTCPEDGWAELVWNGTPRPLQLRLNFDGRGTIDGAVLRDILDELAEDGVRDWLVNHRMAGEQGATGTFRWSWAEHRQRTDYDRRIAQRKATDEQLAEAVVHRLQRLQHAELRWYRKMEGNMCGWLRIGPPWLVDVPAGVDELTLAGRSLRVALMHLNPETYKGAHRNAEQPHFALLPEAALELPGPELRLLTLLAYDWTYARDPEGVVRKGKMLWRYANIRKGEHTERKRWPAATRTLQRKLDRLGKLVGLDWNLEGGPEESAETRYRIRPPDWWKERVLLGVPPEYGSSRTAVPRTGNELQRWRDDYKLSQRALAEVLGVSQPTVCRAEHGGAKPLSLELVNSLADFIAKTRTR